MSDKPSKSGKPRQYVTLSYATLRRFILWAETRDASVSGWMKSVLTLRANENWASTKTWIEEHAQLLGITPEELETKLLEKNNFNFEGFRQELLGDGDERSDE